MLGSHVRTVETPWGRSDDAGTVHAPGITFYSTPGHGGYGLSASRQATVAKRFPLFRTFAGGPWYEEDQDMAIVVLAFPDLFKIEQWRSAIRTVHGSIQIAKDLAANPRYHGSGDHGWTSVAAWLTTPAAKPIVDAVAKFDADRAQDWETGSMGSGKTPRSWWVSLNRVGDNQRIEIDMPGYPEQRFYTTAELVAIDPAVKLPDDAVGNLFTVIYGYESEDQRKYAATFDAAIALAKADMELDDDEVATLRGEWYWAKSDGIGGTDWINIEGPGRPATAPPSMLAATT